MKTLCRVLLVGMFALSFGMANLVAAQPSEDEQALVERAFDALGTLESRPAYQQTGTETTSTVLSLTFLGLTFNLNSEVVIASDLTVINAEAAVNAQGFYTVTVMEENSQGDEPAELTEYVMDAEVRLVDGTVYVLAEYTSSSGEVPPLPTGWTVVTSEEAYDAFDELDMDDWLEQAERVPGDEIAQGDDKESVGGDDVLSGELGNLLQDEVLIQFVINHTSDISSTPATLPDGSTGETINLTLDLIGLLNAAAATPEGREALNLDDPSQDTNVTELLTALGIEPINLTVMLDADGNLAGQSLALTMRGEEVDFGQFEPDAEGAVMDFMLQGVESLEYTTADATAPVSAPQ